MGASVSKLDKAGWSAEALGRLAKFEAEKTVLGAFKAAKAVHPFAQCLDGLTDEARAVSEAPRHKFKFMDFGNGHKEVTVSRHEPKLEQTLERAIERDASVMTPRGEGDRERSKEVAARRAKQQVRYLAKAMLVNSLWTLTYKENVQDRERVLRDLKEFRRRVVAVLGEWKYIAVIELQKRGAMHLHLATHALPVRILQGGVKVKSWDVMRRIWRSIVGEGNFDEAKRKSRWGGERRVAGAGAIASYIAGYVAKDMLASELNRKRYSHSKGVELPQAQRAMWADDVRILELIELAYEFVGERITRTWFDGERGIFFIESDDSIP